MFIYEYWAYKMTDASTPLHQSTVNFQPETSTQPSARNVSIDRV